MRTQRLLLSALALFALAPLAPAFAADSPAMASFKSLCVSTDAAMKPALAAADQAGWIPLPKGALGESEMEDLDEYDGRIRTADGQISMMLAGSGSAGEGGVKVKMDLCMVAVMADDASAAFRAEIDQFAQIAPSEVEEGGKASWYYFDSPKGRQRVASLDDKVALDAMSKGVLRGLIFETDDEMTMVGYIVPHP